MRKLSFSLVSIVALGALGAVACSSENNGPIVVASGGAAPGAGGMVLPGTGGAGPDTGGMPNGATTGSGGAGAGVSTGGSGAADPGTGGTASVEGVPLSFTDGWLAMDANTLGVQGAVFSYADSHTETGDGVNDPMVTTIEGPTACMAGTAFKVDTMCDETMLTPPATDCYGEYWGAAIGFNLNQPTIPDPDNEGEEIGGDPVAFDATGKISAFSFDLTGDTIPTSMRFSVDIGPDADGATQFCTTKSTKVLAGTNVIKIDDLRSECWEATAFDMNDHPDPSQIVKIAWGVVTNSSSATPFNFCVSNVIAVP